MVHGSAEPGGPAKGALEFRQVGTDETDLDDEALRGCGQFHAHSLVRLSPKGCREWRLRPRLINWNASRIVNHW